MANYKIDKVNSFKICDINTLEPIMESNGIENATIETEVVSSSLSKEVLQFNHYASFEGELTNCSSLLNCASDLNDKPLYIEYDIHIWIQARWHKKKRINKKWLKRYGMKKDKICVRCDVDSIGQYDSYDPYDLVKSSGYNLEISNMQYKFRPDQLRSNLKIEMCYE